MQRAEQHREQLLKTTQESAASEVAKAKHIAQEHEGKAAETSEAPTPTKGREIPRD